MPIYPYSCTECLHQHDALQKLSDPLLTVCPACGKPSLKKQVTAAGFQLKGSGWYATDFKGGASRTDAPASTKSADDAPSTPTASPPSPADAKASAACGAACACH